MMDFPIVSSNSRTNVNAPLIVFYSFVFTDKDKLHDPMIYKRFSEILTKAKSNRASVPGSGGETNLQEFEQEIESARLAGMNDVELEEATQAKLAKSRRRKEPAAAITRSTREATAPVARSSRRGAAKVARESSHADNSDDDI
jgi:condensin complex subunit 1